jgi:hypothetical protein
MLAFTHMTFLAALALAPMGGVPGTCIGCDLAGSDLHGRDLHDCRPVDAATLRDVAHANLNGAMGP